jgi:hypothetical protein
MGRSEKKPKLNERVEIMDIAIRHMTQILLCQIWSITRQSVARWNKEGIPRNPDGTYDLITVNQWLRKRWEHDARHGPKQDALERWRTARAKISEKELARLDEDLCDRAYIEEGVNAFLARLKEMGDALQRKFGPEAHDLIVQHLEAAQRIVDRYIKRKEKAEQAEADKAAKE